MAWIESHQSLQRHPKTTALMVELQCDRYKVIGHMHALWWWAIDIADEDGNLPKRTSDIDITEAAGWPVEQAKAFVKALRKAGWLERRSYQLHDWKAYTWRFYASKSTASKGGSFGNHKRWHLDRGVISEDCEFCVSEESEKISENSPKNGDASLKKSPRTGSPTRHGALARSENGANGEEDGRPTGTNVDTKSDPIATRPRVGAMSGGESGRSSLSESHQPTPPTLPTDQPNQPTDLATDATGNGHSPAADGAGLTYQMPFSTHEIETLQKAHGALNVGARWREFVDWVKEEEERMPTNLLRAFRGFLKAEPAKEKR